MNWFKKIILGVLLTGCMDNNVQPMGFLTKAAIGSGIVVGAAVAVGGAAVASSYLIPFRFPEPTGLFGVGTEIHHLNNSENTKVLESESVQPRDLKIQFWYPTEHKVAQANYPWAKTLVVDLKKMTKMVYLLGLDSIFTHAQPSAPLAKSKEAYPVILYSHGSGSGLGDNASLCEELASRGYIVVGIGHPQETARANAFVKLSYEKYQELLTKEIEIWVAEAQSVLDYLEKLSSQQGSRFSEKLDLATIGMAGHSLGGTTAVELCGRDKRCKAVVDMDGALFGKNFAEPVGKPVMFLLAGESSNIPEKDQIALCQTKENFQDMMQHYLPAFNSLMEAQGHDAYKVTIKGANHMSFSDQALINYHSPIVRFVAWYMGMMDGYRCHEIMKSYVVAFFDKYLKHKDSALLTKQPSPFSEVDTQFLI